MTHHQFTILKNNHGYTLLGICLLILLTGGGFIYIQQAVNKSTHAQRLSQIQVDIDKIRNASILFYNKYQTEPNKLKVFSILMLIKAHLLQNTQAFKDYYIQITKSHDHYTQLEITYQNSDLKGYTRSEITHFLYPTYIQKQQDIKLTWRFPLAKFEQVQAPMHNFLVGAA